MTCVCVHHTSWPVRSRDTYTETCRERHNFQSELSGAFPRLFSCMCVTTLSSFLSHCAHILSVRVCLSLSLSLSHTTLDLRVLCPLFTAHVFPHSLSLFLPLPRTHTYPQILFYFIIHIFTTFLMPQFLSISMVVAYVCVCVRLHTL